MTQPESNGTLALRPAAASVTIKTVLPPPANDSVPGQPHPVASDTSPEAREATTFPEPPCYFGEALKDAERLLKYAAEIGSDVDPGIRDAILHARAVSYNGWDEATAVKLLAALTKLAAQLKPVTAESLKACTENTQYTVHNYWWVALCLAILIVPFSIVSFVTSSISTALRADIVTADDLAVKLRAQLGAPLATPSGKTGTADPAPAKLPPGLNEVDVITELQTFAATIRSIDARARQLNVLVLHAERDPFVDFRRTPDTQRTKFQLPDGLRNFVAARDNRIPVFQDARYFAQNLLDDVSFFYGAITTCLLPVLYALLGTCAYLLRSFEHQMKARTFTPSAATNSARFLIAAIGGAVVGLFNNFSINQGASIPPLAIAFLVGYAVDVFFSFLEGLVQAFTKTGSGATSTAPAPAAVKA